MRGAGIGSSKGDRVGHAGRGIVIVAALLLASCAVPVPSSSFPQALLHDDLFTPPSEPLDTSRIFAVSEPMKRYLNNEIATQTKMRDVQGGLIETINRARMRLEYDATYTRTASEAFDARTGNCLSLVLMTAAFAKELGLQVRYQTAIFEETWSRSGTLLVRSGHVNISVDPRLQDRRGSLLRTFTIDFLPEADARRLKTREISEATIIAMYLNNRAVEALVAGRVDDAYSWSSAAVRQDPNYLGAQNTLGTVYARHGNPGEAEEVYLYILRADPSHTRAMSNLADMYDGQGRTAEAAVWHERLAKLEPEPPYFYFNQGVAALKANDFAAARDMFERETIRSRDSAEAHYWLGIAYLRLGDTARAAKHLGIALDFSTTRVDRDLYSAKLEVLRKSTQH